MPKFKVGDKIEFEMDGKKVSGTITRDYNSPDHAMYDVRVGTKTMTIADTPMRPANACKNAKFKVGDKVTDGSGVYLITGIDNDFGSYEWKLISGRADRSHSKGGDFGWADAKMSIANTCKNAKIVTPENFSSLRVGDKVDFRKSRYYKGIGVVTKVYSEDIIDVKDDRGEILEVHSDDIMNARACNSRNPIVRKAMNACVKNAAYPKSLSKAVGKVEAAFIPKENFMILERGDYRSSDYVDLEGSPADVRRKARASLQGKDLSDAMSLCEWADSEMEKYRKSEQSHGRKVAQNGRDILMELGMIEGDIEDGDMAEARSWLREIKNEAMRKGCYKEWNQLAMRAGM